MTTNFTMKIEGQWKKHILPKDLPESTELTSADQLLVDPSIEEETLLNAKYNEYKNTIVSSLEENQNYSFIYAQSFIKEGDVFLSLLKEITTT